MTATQFMENVSQIVAGKAKSMVHDLDGLQKQSLILASLVLVLSRMWVARASSVKAKGTPEEPYRYRELVRTYIREICGWIFGFVVLRQLQKGIQWGLGKWLNIREVQNPNDYSMFKELKNLCKTGSFKPFIPEHGNDLTPVIGPESTAMRSALLAFRPHHVEAAPFIRSFYKYAPIALASIPTVILAGAYLERGTRKYSDTVANFFSKHAKLQNAIKPSPKPLTVPRPLPSVMAPAPCPPNSYNARFTGMGAPSPWPVQPPLGTPGRLSSPMAY